MEKIDQSMLDINGYLSEDREDKVASLLQLHQIISRTVRTWTNNTSVAPEEYESLYAPKKW